MAITGCDVVNNPAPIPSFTVTPSSPVVGESVTLDAFETQHRIPGTRWEWDVNGDGEGDQAYDGSGGVEIQASFDAPGTYEVGLAASNITSTETGFMHVYGFTSRTVVVRPADPAPPPPANRPPVAGFETDADPGYTEVAVAFDASASGDPDGRIAKYEWDFDGDGEFDRDTTTADTRFAYDRAGVYKARLRVTDDGGGTAEKVAAVPVELGPPPSGVRAAGRSGTSSSLLMDGEMVDQGDGFMTNASMTQVGIRARGEMVFRNLPRPLPAKRDAEWRARFSVQRRGEQSQRVAAEGYLVVGFGSRDRLCMSGRLAGAYGEPVLGRLAILGGAGAVRRAGGTFDVAVPPSALGAKGMRLGGTLRLRQGRRARALPPPCRALIRALAR
jgi:PKD repeat protein